MTRPAFGSIWLEPTPLKLSLPWRAQLVNYIAEFPTEEAAKKYVAAIQAEIEREQKSTARTLRPQP